MEQIFTNLSFYSLLNGQNNLLYYVISSENITLQAAERSLWCVVNIFNNFLVICAVQQIVKILHSNVSWAS